MIRERRLNFALITILIIILSCEVDGWKRFFRGRRYDGMLGKPRTPQNITLPPAEWFDQQLDHFKPTDPQTWKQRYFTNTTFYIPGGPVFLMIGGEGPASAEWMVIGQWINYAQRYNALCFQLEHRYYGLSHPVPDLSVKSMMYLSSEQALADLAYFIKNMTKKYDLPPETRWIAFGGSYPGSLAAWLRAKYPHLLHGAVSASGPLLAKADFREYYRVVEDDLDTVAKTSCVSAIRDATKQLQMLLRSHFGQETVNKMFKLCDPIDVLEKNDVSNLFESLAGNIAEVAQYNKDNRHFEGARSNITLDDICGVMINQSLGTPVHRYATVNNKLLEIGDEKCLDYKYDKMIAQLQEIDWRSETSAGGRQWIYQTCTEFGFYQTSNLTAQVFGDQFPLEFFIQQCRDIFGERYDEAQLQRGIERTNIMYGELHVRASRVVYVHGSVDPWHALGITKTLQKESPAIYIKGTAHCADMYPSAESDPPQLRAARRMISDLIGEWLEEN